MVGFVSDRALAMLGKNNGTAAKLKNKMKEFKGMTSFLSLHCILHQQAPCKEFENETVNLFVQVSITIMNL
jgi:hypothetical protein